MAGERDEQSQSSSTWEEGYDPLGEASLLKLRYEESLIQEAARHAGDPSRREELPAAFRTIMQQHEEQRQEAFKGYRDHLRAPVVRSYDQSSWATMELLSSFRDRTCLSESISEAEYTTFEAYESSLPNGWINEDGVKVASGGAGTARLGAHQFSRVVFGFRTRFPLPGAENAVTVRSSVHVLPTWLEALSFGKASYGRTEAYCRLVARVEYYQYDAPGSQLRSLWGESPRGNWREGDIGIWHPQGLWWQDAESSLSFDHAGEGRIVEVWEQVELVAKRYHRADRCNAVIQVQAEFEPLRVEVCHRN